MSGIFQSQGLRAIAEVRTKTQSLQQIMLSSFLSAKAPTPSNFNVLPHLVRTCFWGIIPYVLILEFSSHGVISANMYYRTEHRRMYGLGLACSLSHLVNAPYSWGLLKVIMNGDKPVQNIERRMLKAALQDFVRMNRLRILLSEVPLMIIVLVGALADG
ncbi:hypothetical protein GGR57DRAFT_453113 [Xylariaceae sp. FL1272]|nr:hypothetical protein GGR57DRAFT_453113 [Xylariaceae sp. FL1272]